VAIYKEKNKGSSQFNQRFGLLSAESSPGRGANASQIEFYELEPAEVLDIILDENHPQFKDYRDIGKAKVRFVTSQNGMSSEVLTYAKPLDSNIKSYPLVHEVVIAVNYLGDLYYTQRMNIFNNPNENSYPGVSLPSLQTKGSGGKGSAKEYNEISTSGSPNKKNDQSAFSLGKIFSTNKNIKPIKPFEGDIIYEGRFGQSIKFGSNPKTHLPNMKIKVGHPEEVPNKFLALIEENINDDPNSLWITSDEEIGFNPATLDSDVHLQFYPNKPPTFIGNQLFINSDRVVLNARQNEIMGFAKKAINLVSSGIFTIDAVGETIINSSNKVIVNTPQIYLGSKDAKEQVVLGTTLKKLLEELIDAITKLTVPTGTGPSGPPINTSQFISIKQKLEQALSQQNYTL